MRPARPIESGPRGTPQSPWPVGLIGSTGAGCGPDMRQWGHVGNVAKQTAPGLDQRQLRRLERPRMEWCRGTRHRQPWPLLAPAPLSP